MTDQPNPQLSGLLEQAVPDDAPVLDARALAATARRSRNRSRAAVAGVAALVVVGGAATWAALDGRGDDSKHVAGEDSSAPYDAPACPTTLPELSDATTSVDSLEGLASVRLCPDLAPPALTVEAPPLSEQKAILAGMDALIEDLPGFVDRVTATEAFDPGRCAALDVLNTRTSLQFTYADGRQVLVPTGMCLPITVADREIDGGDLHDAFRSAVDHQRDVLAYRRDLEGDLTCERQRVSTAAKAGRERVVAAVRCDITGPEEDPTVTGRPLAEEEVREVDAAWQRPGPVPNDPTATDDESLCTAPESRPSYLLVVTDRADVVQLTETGCGYLLWHGHGPGELTAIPTTLADLTP